MKPEEALSNIKKVCEMYKGTLDEHKILQTSISILENTMKENNSDKSYEKEEETDSK